MKNRRIIALACVLLLLAGCGDRVGLAPVEELKYYRQTGHETTHRVRPGETLYAVAFRYDKDYRELAIVNHLRPPYYLRSGQLLQLTIPAKAGRQFSANHRNYGYTSQTRKKVAVWSVKKTPQITLPKNNGRWLWPAQGRVANNFIPAQGKKGIDIAGKKGELVRAAAGGVVAYAGNGLSGYGNLIIIKHDGSYLTAYANNSRNRVTEGQKVKAGQVIADMGIIDRRFWGVHFEIRHAGQPVNPLNYLGHS